MFREENFMEALQEIQTLIPFEETADTALESLREILLTEYVTEETESIRQDILAGSIEAKNVLQQNFRKQESVNTRNINPHHDSEVGASAHSSLHQTKTLEFNQSAQVDAISKTAQLETIKTKSNKNWTQKAFGSVDISANEGDADKKRSYVG
jgi:hypothetical protein